MKKGLAFVCLTLFWQFVYCQTEEYLNISSFGGAWRLEKLELKSRSYINTNNHKEVFVFSSNGNFKKYVSDYKYKNHLQDAPELISKEHLVLSGTWELKDKKLILHYIQSTKDTSFEGYQRGHKLIYLDGQKAVFTIREGNSKRGAKFKLILKKI